MLRVLVFLVLSGFLSACAAEQTTNQANLGGKADEFVDAEGSLPLDGEEGDVEVVAEERVHRRDVNH